MRHDYAIKSDDVGVAMINAVQFKVQGSLIRPHLIDFMFHGSGGSDEHQFSALLEEEN